MKSSGEFNYTDNWNFAKGYCSSIISASEKIAQPFNAQFKVSIVSTGNFEFSKSVKHSLIMSNNFEPLAQLYVHEGI